MKKIGMYLLYVAAMLMAATALWSFNAAEAAEQEITRTDVSVGVMNDTTIATTVLDNSAYPDIVARLECSGSDIPDMIAACRTALEKLCPDGGSVSEMGETPEGALPAKIMFVIAC